MPKRQKDTFSLGEVFQASRAEGVLVHYDIAQGEHISERHFSRCKDGNDITLRLTNEEKHLTTMPCIHKLPSSVRRVEFDASCSCITTIAGLRDDTGEDGFLSNSNGLECVDLRVLSRLVEFGDHFLANCPVETVKFPTATDRAFSGAVGLTIGACFLERCFLETIDLSYFADLEEIPCKFLRSAKYLTELDLSGFKRLRCIDDEFLASCIRLRSVHFPPGVDGVTIGSGFLYECENLESIDLSFMCNNGQDEMPSGFLTHCESLTALDLTPLNHVKQIAPDFLYGCHELTVVDLSTFHQLRVIGEYFLIHLQSLKTVLLPPKPHDGAEQVNIGRCFMYGCTCLRTVDLSFLSGITTVPDDFLANCELLEEVDLTPLANVTSVGSGFLEGVETIKHIQLPFIENLTSVGDGFLSNCSALRTVRIMQVPRILRPSLSIPKRFLCCCPLLECLDLRFISSDIVTCEDANDEVLDKCTPDVLKVIVIEGLPNTRKPAQWINTVIPKELHMNVVFSKPGDSFPQLQWSWKDHSRHPQGVQLGVLWMFAGLQHQPGRLETRNIPSEVAHEICRYIGTPFDELLASPSPQKIVHKPVSSNATVTDIVNKQPNQTSTPCVSQETDSFSWLSMIS